MEEKEFLKALPHYYLEENNLHALKISNMEEIERFLPYIDKWKTNDIMNPRSLRKDLDKTNIHAHEWLHGKDIYSRRYAITTFS